MAGKPPLSYFKLLRMKSRRFPRCKRSPPDDSWGVPHGDPLYETPLATNHTALPNPTALELRKRPFYTPCRPGDSPGTMHFHGFSGFRRSQNPSKLVVFHCETVNLSRIRTRHQKLTHRQPCGGVWGSPAWCIERAAPILFFLWGHQGFPWPGKITENRRKSVAGVFMRSQRSFGYRRLNCVVGS